MMMSILKSTVALLALVICITINNNVVEGQLIEGNIPSTGKENDMKEKKQKTKTTLQKLINKSYQQSRTMCTEPKRKRYQLDTLFTLTSHIMFTTFLLSSLPLFFVFDLISLLLGYPTARFAQYALLAKNLVSVTNQDNNDVRLNTNKREK